MAGVTGQFCGVSGSDTKSVSFFNAATENQGGLSYNAADPGKYTVVELGDAGRASLVDHPIVNDASYAVINNETGNAGVHMQDGSTIGVVTPGDPPVGFLKLGSDAEALQSDGFPCVDVEPITPSVMP